MLEFLNEVSYFPPTSSMSLWGHYPRFEGETLLLQSKESLT